ncbi:MAG: Asp-tRNA(Asn)/Glu-tRNA(Gln) amidotransferase subunit GatB [Spirochaetaceae bacterium]|nr:Asp-tRNA(Asn)/Glu-tRNA(Gln) amidotransferase subunit GatB [Spirochaetaceae bacterium]
MYQSFIGLEVHIHLLTKTKVFCGCKQNFGDGPNTNVCPVCLGYPGVLPALNVEAMRMGCTVARALGCTIPPKTWFDRKQYFYPDMTKNYQISQFHQPLGQDGLVTIEGRGIQKTVRIKECHLEEDAGKMIHAGTASLLDYNRAGYALLEIVTEPDMESGEEAELFIRQLRRTVRYLGVCDGNMEEGSLRADANVSINTPGAGLGRKVEIKNLNSSRFVKLGLNYEIKRQAGLLDEGKMVVQETRLWNENRDQTEPMRTKENAQDYRYFPEPDLPVFVPDAAFLRRVEEGVCELPLARVKRFIAEYGLGEENADALCDEKAFADYYEDAVVKALAEGLAKPEAAAKVANLLLGDVKHILAKAGADPATIGDTKLTPARLASLVVMTAQGAVSAKNAKQVLAAVFDEDKDPPAIIKERGWEQMTDPAQIGEAVDGVLAAEAATLADARSAKAAGNEKRAKTLTAYLAGKVIAATGGRADPGVVGRLLGERV